MRPLLLAPCFLLTACLPDPPEVVVAGQGCESIALAVADPAVLPGWTVHAMVAERVGGDTVWTLASDPKGALMLQPWPHGPALELTDLGEADDFSLLPGRDEGESWLLLARQDRLRVWRLGAAAQGEVVASPDLTGFPGPGRYAYQLLMIGDVPYLLATTTGVPSNGLRFQLAPLDPEHLTLGKPGPSEKFSALCQPVDGDGCRLLSGSTLTEVRALAVSEPGRMAGAAALFGLRFTPVDSISPAFITLQAIDRGAGRHPELIARMIGLFAAQDVLAQRGRLATDGTGLYSSALVAEVDGSIETSGFGLAYTWLADRTSSFSWLFWDQGGPLLQLGDQVIVGGFEGEHWQFSRVEHGRITTPIQSDVQLVLETQMWSAGHEQLFVRPPGGPAMRIAAQCVQGP